MVQRSAPGGDPDPAGGRRGPGRLILRAKYTVREGPWTVNGRERLGSAVKASGRDKHLHGYDFLLLINYDCWMRLTGAQRQALVDHELCHMGRNPDAEAWCIWPHDIEDFAAVIERNGLWSKDVAMFTQVAKKARVPGEVQLGLSLDGDAAEEDDPSGWESGEVA